MRATGSDTDAIQADARLMQRVSQGDGLAWRQLTDDLLPRAYTLAKRLLQEDSQAEEVAEEAFYRLWQQAAGWRGEARIATWLYRVVHNLALDRLRARHGQAELDEIEELADTAPSPLQQLEHKEEQQRLHQALAALPVRQREAILLIHLLEAGVNQTCQVMNIGRQALESLLARGRRQLKKRLLEP